MTKPLLKELIQRLKECREDYLDKHKTEPVIWNFEMSCGDFESLELTHKPKKKGPGLLTAVNGTETYELESVNE